MEKVFASPNGATAAQARRRRSLCETSAFPVRRNANVGQPFWLSSVRECKTGILACPHSPCPHSPAPRQAEMPVLHSPSVSRPLGTPASPPARLKKANQCGGGAGENPAGAVPCRCRRCALRSTLLHLSLRPRGDAFVGEELAFCFGAKGEAR
jgi:hypothetical protein